MPPALRQTHSRVQFGMPLRHPMQMAWRTRLWARRSIVAVSVLRFGTSLVRGVRLVSGWALSLTMGLLRVSSARRTWEGPMARRRTGVWLSSVARTL